MDLAATHSTIKIQRPISSSKERINIGKLSEQVVDVTTSVNMISPGYFTLLAYAPTWGFSSSSWRGHKMPTCGVWMGRLGMWVLPNVHDDCITFLFRSDSRKRVHGENNSLYWAGLWIMHLVI